MFGEEEIDVGFPNNVAFGVGCSIYVVCSDLSVKLFQGKLSLRCESWVDEISGGAAVDDGSGFNDLIIYRDFYGDAQSFIQESGKYKVDLGSRH